MAWSEDETTRLVHAYFAYWALTNAGAPVAREIRDRHGWAVERVQEDELDGTLPLDVLDALLKAPGGDEHYRSYVAAGPLEVLLGHHRERYGEAIAMKCQTDPVWAEAAGGVWLSRERWEELPTILQRLVPEPRRQVSKARRTRKATSKRQRPRPRHG